MKARAGVTLMELIVALTVTGFMAAVGTATFGAIIDNRRVIRESTAVTERSASLRETLRSWLTPATINLQIGGLPNGATRSTVRTANSNATTRTQNGAEGVTAAAQNGDELIFTTTAPNPANAPNARMRLFIDGDDETPETGLTVEYQVNQQAPLQRRQLDSTITEMAVEYLDRATGRWVAPSAVSGNSAPRAMRLSLMAADGTSSPALMSLPLIIRMNSLTIQVNRTPTTR